MPGTLLTIIQPPLAEYETANQNPRGREREREEREGVPLLQQPRRASHQRSRTCRPSFNSNFYLYESCIIVSRVENEPSLRRLSTRVQLPRPLPSFFALCRALSSLQPLQVLSRASFSSVEFPASLRNDGHDCFISFQCLRRCRSSLEYFEALF